MLTGSNFKMAFGFTIINIIADIPLWILSLKVNSVESRSFLAAVISTTLGT